MLAYSPNKTSDEALEENVRVYNEYKYTKPPQLNFKSPTSYKSSLRGLNPWADPILSSKKNLSLSTAALSPIHFENLVASVPGISMILGYPLGFGISFLVLQRPVEFWRSGLSIQLCNNFADSGCGASVKIAPVCGHATKVPVVGKDMLRGEEGLRPIDDVKVAVYVPFEERMRVAGVAVPRTQRGFWAMRASSHS